MIHLSIWLTLIVLVFTAVILMVIKAIAGRSGNFFMKQQRSIADVNGYIEEMVNGQKVVKVFCYEEKAKERFKEKNENLGNTTAMANTLANILMPVTGLFTGGVDFSKLSAKIGDATVTYGMFIQNVIDFLIIAGCIFIMVKAMNKLIKKKEEEPAPAAPKPSAEEKLLSEIRDLLKNK